MVWSIAMDIQWLAFPDGSRSEVYTWMTASMSRIEQNKTLNFVPMTKAEI